MSTPPSVSSRRPRSAPCSGRTGRYGHALARSGIGVRWCGAESMLVLACTLSKRMGFSKCVSFFLYARSDFLALRAWSDRVVSCGRLERLWGVGRSSGITWSRAGPCCRARNQYIHLSVAINCHCALTASSSIIDSILHVLYSGSSTEL